MHRPVYPEPGENAENGLAVADVLFSCRYIFRDELS